MKGGGDGLNKSDNQGTLVGPGRERVPFRHRSSFSFIPVVLLLPSCASLCHIPSTRIAMCRVRVRNPGGSRGSLPVASSAGGDSAGEPLQGRTGGKKKHGA